ncbi:hypothetical protein BS47DRAFT_1336269 [Hydnum rufescens UP504]|uniref:Uncharacterized protein n=1 Tax=Hydnum rufescens UP504 TaxID=1448309 RepID=A0A9P6BC18_9AGAM|nr:hypothetical protein BS47DRAFT_1336269 [Hydnum rufescens UP504]
MMIRRDPGSPSHWTPCPVPKNQVPGQQDENRGNPGAPAHENRCAWAPGCPLPLQTFTPCGQYL